MESEKITIFIGSGEASLIERKVFIYSLKKHSKRNIDIYVFNGTHDTFEKNDEPPVRINMPLNIKYANVTEFSNYRWFIPQICGFKGKAIWADSDMLVLTDIGDIFDLNMDGQDILARSSAYGSEDDKKWGLSLCLIDCEKAQMNPVQYFDEIAKGLYTYSDLHQMTPSFLKYHPYKLGEIPIGWNVFDKNDENTKLIHYTNLYTQPWKATNHPEGELWFKYFNEAIKSGAIHQEDIHKTLLRFYARQDLMKGNSPLKNKIGKKNAIQQLINEFL